MPFEFIQIPANGQGSAKGELNKLLRSGRIASVRKKFVANGEDSFWAFCIEFLNGVLGLKRRATDTTPLGLRNARDPIPKVATTQRNLGLRDAIPLGLGHKAAGGPLAVILALCLLSSAAPPARAHNFPFAAGVCNEQALAAIRLTVPDPPD